MVKNNTNLVSKLIKATLAIMLFLFALITIYWVHINYFRVNVLLYSAILDGLIAVLIMILFIFYLKSMDIFNSFEKIILCIICLLSSYIFAISVPTVIDRSLSFYLLGKIQQKGGEVKKSKLVDIFINEYVKEHHLIDVRLTEQLQSGTIVLNEDCVMLTTRGQEIASFSRFFRKNFLPKNRLLNNNYTDVLVDPFALTSDEKGYVGCK